MAVSLHIVGSKLSDGDNVGDVDVGWIVVGLFVSGEEVGDSVSGL